MARTIKRYGNRKLYDVAASAYVSLEDIAALIRGGETVEVLDNVTGEDITAQTLTQVVLEEGKRGKSMLPTDLLHDLLRRGGRAIDAGAGLVRHGVDELVQGSLGRITRALRARRRRSSASCARSSRSWRAPWRASWTRRKAPAARRAHRRGTKIRD